MTTRKLLSATLGAEATCQEAFITCVQLLHRQTQGTRDLLQDLPHLRPLFEGIHLAHGRVVLLHQGNKLGAVVEKPHQGIIHFNLHLWKQTRASGTQPGEAGAGALPSPGVPGARPTQTPSPGTVPHCRSGVPMGGTGCGVQGLSSACGWGTSHWPQGLPQPLGGRGGGGVGVFPSRRPRGGPSGRCACGESGLTVAAEAEGRAEPAAKGGSALQAAVLGAAGQHQAAARGEEGREAGGQAAGQVLHVAPALRRQPPVEALLVPHLPGGQGGQGGAGCGGAAEEEAGVQLSQAADLPGRGVAGTVAEHSAELQRGAGGGQPRPRGGGTQRQRVPQQVGVHLFVAGLGAEVAAQPRVRQRQEESQEGERSAYSARRHGGKCAAAAGRGGAGAASSRFPLALGDVASSQARGAILGEVGGKAGALRGGPQGFRLPPAPRPGRWHPSERAVSPQSALSPLRTSPGGAGGERFRPIYGPSQR